MKSNKTVNPLITFEHKRDAYGFTVRPQHLQRYREYANIYKEEEEERSDRWNSFLDRQAESSELATDGLVVGEGEKVLGDEAAGQEADTSSEKGVDGHEASNQVPGGSDSAAENGSQKEEVPPAEETKVHRVQLWTDIRSSLRTIEDMMSVRVKKKTGSVKDEQIIEAAKSPSHSDDVKSPKGAAFEEDSEEEFYDVERSDPSPDMPVVDGTNASANGITADAAPPEASFPWKEELEVLVRGGVPMALRGELWQAFVGVKARRVEKYYQDLLASENDSEIKTDQQSMESTDSNGKTGADFGCMPEKWKGVKGQIEKDLPRTFPGHPALDEDGRNALRRLLTAYARHNPSVGYCQAMNFFAGLLLLLMPEENAFWTLMGILDDYFDGYYSEEMIESQVDQLVFEELVRERFPKLGFQSSGLSGSAGGMGYWTMVPVHFCEHASLGKWSVLRVWDVLLFEGNRVMLFRTAVALMELYGPALVTTKDAGDAVTLLQSLAGSTFDSSQLVLTACMGYQNINETRLQQLRNKHRPAVIASIEERSKGLKAWKDSQGLASKLADMQVLGNLSRTESGSTNADEILISLTGEGEIDAVPDLQEQVVCLKVELCRLLEEKRSAILRAEELETALMEMVKQDNRRQLSAKVEQLDEEVAQLRQALADKQEQETAMLQVLMRVEQEQKVTEDARRFAEQDAAAQRYAAQVLQEKYEEATAALAEMEKRAVMAESMLEATLQYQSGQVKVLQSPRSSQSDSPVSRNNQEPDIPARRISLLSRPFGLGWRDRNKGKPTNEEPAEGNPSVEEQNTISEQDVNGLKVQDESRKEVSA
ncbi:hypothetical protein JHK84_057241 [Glycine max]|nr:hypothetical protein JHK86_057182 [Glycine max]KAG5076010.1 hypothetical protein JHK84_057241 [Glycine max]KAH1192253.1 TBC1 domain family member 8B [Glycine max]KAH1192254.1 TBC1 domain family member 8B [Glycine max]KAH1192255.1 TBC1 domain family member 8B [Glycine max]